MIRLVQLRRRRLSRAALMLVAWGWLGAALQPCLAQASAMPAGMVHCDHGGTGHPTPCPEMRLDDCAAARDAAADAPRHPDLPRGATLAMPQTTADPGSAPPAPRLPPAAAPGLARHLFLCRLRN